MSTPYCTDLILPLANQIWQDLGAPANQSIGFLSGWLVSTGGMIGALNNRVGSCVYTSGSNPCLVNFDPELGAIANLMYQAGYYRVQSVNVLAGGGQTLWTSLSEGDSKISRSNMVDVAKQFRELYVETELQLNKQIHYYTLNHTTPQGINSDSLYSWPSP